MANTLRHYLSTEDLGAEDLRQVLELSKRIKLKGPREAFRGKSLGLIFLARSLRTRVSFEVAMNQLGGHCITLDPERDVYRHETLRETVMDGPAEEHVKDAARTLSRYLDGIGIRLPQQRNSWEEDRSEALLRGYAAHASVPIINLQSPLEHPCQALADVFTMQERCRSLKGRKLTLAWTQNPSSPGPGIPHSLILLATRLGMDVTLSHPQGFELDAEILSLAQRHAAESNRELRITHDLDEACEGAEFLYARSWCSLSCYGDPDRETLLKRNLDNWKITQAQLDHGNNAFLMQPLPVRRNLSVDDAVLDGPRSLAYDQAGNRLQVQKALLLHLL